MILMPQIFDVIANENACYKRNELECCCMSQSTILPVVEDDFDVLHGQIGSFMC